VSSHSLWHKDSLLLANVANFTLEHIMDEDELKRRTKLFGLRIIKLVAALPNTIHAKIIGGQLVRAGTSVGANYRAACRARS